MSHKIFFVGGKLAIRPIVKKTQGTGLHGVKVARPSDFKRLGAGKRTVSRPYGGSLTGAEVRSRITRAFLIEEVKMIKRMVLQQKDKSNKKKKGKKAKAVKK